MKKSIKCPECGKLTEYSKSNEYRPFCSKRCSLIDLGEWVEGSYSIESEDQVFMSESQSDDVDTRH